MRRPALLLTTALAALTIVACVDREPTTVAPPPRAPSALRADLLPWTQLPDTIRSLYHILLGNTPTGLDTAANARFTNIQRFYAAGQTDSAQAANADLSAWLIGKQSFMTAPSGYTVDDLLKQLLLFMEWYVTGQNQQPVGDGTIGVAIPGQDFLLKTPELDAGIFIPGASIPNTFVLVITENLSPYRRNCEGPLSTTLCQYPRFYEFTPTPYTVLTGTPGNFAVCRAEASNVRDPLFPWMPDSYHDNFRLAHTLPSSPSFYTPGSTIVDQIEILQRTTSILNCEGNPDNVYNVSMATPSGAKGTLDRLIDQGSSELQRLASALGNTLAPSYAYAIDLGGGGSGFSFSPFNMVDPQSRPDLAVLSTQTTVPNATAEAAFTLDDIDVTNVGSASTGAVSLTVTIRPASNPGATPDTLAKLSLTDLGYAYTDLQPGEHAPKITVNLPPEQTGNYLITVSGDAASPLTETAYGTTDTRKSNNSATITVAIAGTPAPNGGAWGTPVIDGSISAGEWNPAGCRPTTVTLPSGNTRAATFCIENDATNAYFMLRIPNASQDPHSVLSVDFDRDNSLAVNAGDDRISYDNAFADQYWYKSGNNVLSALDGANGGATNGAGAFKVGGGNNGPSFKGAIYELSHPLNSGDANGKDIAITSLTTGLCLRTQLIVVSNSQNYLSMSIPVGTTAPTGWGFCTYTNPANGKVSTSTTMVRVPLASGPGQ